MSRRGLGAQSRRLLWGCNLTAPRTNGGAGWRHSVGGLAWEKEARGSGTPVEAEGPRRSRGVGKQELLSPSTGLPWVELAEHTSCCPALSPAPLRPRFPSPPPLFSFPSPLCVSSLSSFLDAALASPSLLSSFPVTGSASLSFPPVRATVAAPSEGPTVPVGTPVVASGWFARPASLYVAPPRGPAGRQHPVM